MSRTWRGEEEANILIIQDLKAFTKPSVPNKPELKSLSKGLKDFGRKGGNRFGVSFGGDEMFGNCANDCIIVNIIKIIELYIF